MENIEEYTIAALATAPGGSIAVIRISGPDALSVVQQVWCGRVPLDREPYRTMRLGEIIGHSEITTDQALAVYFPAPNSYTGEEMAEIHCHGGSLVPRLVLTRLLECGCRHAQAGEFTKRAFLNGRMDLTQAEAVADVIQAQTEKALRMANKQLQGELSERIHGVYTTLTDLLSEFESRLDFPEEDLDWLPIHEVYNRIQQVQKTCESLLSSEWEGEILRHGVKLVLAGPPNVGKSSLLNAILGRDRAIVTEIAGTTRDTLEELAHIRGIPLKIIDTAGVREARDTVEQAGVERTMDSASQAELILWVIDATTDWSQQWPPAFDSNAPLIPVVNKSDIASVDTKHGSATISNREPIYTSALTGEGLDKLFDTVEEQVWSYRHEADPDVAVSSRQAASLRNALPELKETMEQVREEQWETAAVSLRTAIDHIGEVNGYTASPDVLEQIFSKFCIGK